jgi:hypothetical protein
MNGGRPELYLFILIALTALAIHFPRFARWQEWAQGMESDLARNGTM